AAGSSAWGNDSTFEIAAGQEISDTTSWHHILVVIDRADNAKCKMYVDGKDWTDRKTGDISTVPAVTNTLDLRMGTESDSNASFDGLFDEVVIASKTRSADWVKLCYMNQKEKDVLVTW
ncbi:MAG: LamG domain-containing protein, partial [Fibrobacter sp.]|nr:LamG domain-containing protein [Fibrobacter sp.]